MLYNAHNAEVAMERERWRRVEALYHAASGLEPAERDTFLAKACEDDEELRREVESLLAQDAGSRSLLDCPAWEGAESLLEGLPGEIHSGSRQPVTLFHLPKEELAGQTISHYKIAAKLGQGGMGVVYKAQDTRLDRIVALKFLAPQFVESDEHKQRFLREAKATASLDHPNICTVHEVGEAGGQVFLAMGYVDGREVSARIKERPLKIDEVLDIAIQAAEGLRAAHEKGIVHRDIKSANLMVTVQGQVKVMDFGLAQIGERSHLTKSGAMLGTVAYMSPEQALAKPLDRRTDIWSLGVVLYEMLSGGLPFAGDADGTVVYAIVNTQHEPPTARRSGLPVEVDHIIDKALAKSPGERYQHIEDMLVDLRAVQSGRGVVKPALRPSKLTLTRRAVVAGGGVATLGALGFYAFFGSGSVDSIAVLPFVNVGGDPNAEYLSDGITESLITSFSRAPGLRVMSRNAVFRYKGRDRGAREIGRELGVRAVLNGRLTRREDALSINAELVNTSDGGVLWSDQFNRPVADVLSLHQDISEAVSQKLRLPDEEQRRVADLPTLDPAAYRLYLQGRYHWNRRPEGLAAGADYFQQVVARDPEYAVAWAGLADSYLMLGGWSILRPADTFPKARQAAKRAIEMEETLAEPHATLGYFKTLYERDWAGADRLFRRAIELDPQYATAHHWYAYYFQTIGLIDEAVLEIRRARELDPLSPIVTAEVAYFHICAGHYEQAIQEANKALELAPHFGLAHAHLGQAYALLGRRAGARAEAELTLKYSRGGKYPLMFAALTLAMLGEKDAAREVLDQIYGLSQNTYLSPLIPGHVHAALGNRDEAFDLFEQALEDRSMIASTLRSPILEPISSDPRFSRLFERMGLKP